MKKTETDIITETVDFHFKEAESSNISDILANERTPTARIAAMRHPSATADHISQVLNDRDEDWTVKTAAIQHPNVTADHISQVLNNRDSNGRLRMLAAKHPNATEKHISQVLDYDDNTGPRITGPGPDLDPDVRIAAIKHPKATAAHIESVLKNETDPDVADAAHAVKRSKEASSTGGI
jgi:hypothetical protein